jgi:hypothetical protein
MLGTAFLVLAIAFPRSAQAATQLGPNGLRTAESALASDSGEPSLAALMLTDADLPAGFQPYTPLTGRLDARRARMLGVGGNLSQLGSQPDAWVRTWTSARTGELVRELAVDLGTRAAARATRAFTVSAVLKGGFVTETIAGPAHLEAFRKTGQIQGADVLTLLLPVARGPYLFTLLVRAPLESSAAANRLMGILAAAQLHKVPNNTPDTGTSGTAASSADPSRVAGGILGVLIVYVGIVGGISYLRNPLRRPRRYARSDAARRWPEGLQVRDVSSAAENNKSKAFGRLVVQLFGLTIAAWGADPFLMTYWYVYLILGLTIVWAGGRFIDPRGTGRGRNRAIPAGSRKIRVGFALSVASAMILLGVLSLISYSLNITQSSGAAYDQNLQLVLLSIGVAFVALGAIGFRFARRLGSIEARRLMLRDTRPPVLYLRSFGDDGLKLWTSTLGRSSLIERLSLGRPDAFEEVLVRYLSVLGPVIAVNPPGTKLAPLGAARETLDPADWKSVIATWMEQSALIVFIAPPERVTEGLLWELQAVSANRRWAKTLIIVPPVSPEQIQRRWQAFLIACARLWPFTYPLPAADPRVLVLAFRNNTWALVTANRPTEWSYSAALKQAVDDSPQLAAARSAGGE